MPQYSVKVKWGKEAWPVDVNTDEEPILLKAQIFALTGVQPERQKVVCKGVTLPDDNWGNVKLSNGAALLVLGSKEEDVPKEPVERPRFVEDMNEAELASALELPAGLSNLGNTCYMNATVQCLKTVPELRQALRNYEGERTGGTTGALVVALRDTWQAMEGAACVPPLPLLLTLHAALPRFRELAEGGAGGGAGGSSGQAWAQQDANECWTEMVRILQQKLPSLPGGNASVIEQYFGGRLDTEMRCSECEEEPVTSGQETFLQLSCFISQDVKYLQSGLRSKMQEQITKMSSVLQRDAVFTKSAKISRLPAYLTVQLVRFYYKEKEAINAKILKDVKFPMDLDVYELCSPQLQQKLQAMRDKFKAVDDAKVEAALSSKEKGKGEARRQQTSAPPSKDQPTNTVSLPFSFPDDAGSNNSGLYRLQAVLTHRGRSSSSGHYVAWVRAAAEGWLKCDDDVVTQVSEEDVLKLSGGGDWHCAYVLLYGPRVLQLPEDETKETPAASEPAPMEL